MHSTPEQKLHGGGPSGFSVCILWSAYPPSLPCRSPWGEAFLDSFFTQTHVAVWRKQRRAVFVFRQDTDEKRSHPAFCPSASSCNRCYGPLYVHWQTASHCLAATCVKNNLPGTTPAEVSAAQLLHVRCALITLSYLLWLTGSVAAMGGGSSVQHHLQLNGTDLHDSVSELKSRLCFV